MTPRPETGRWRLGLRREILILLPVALLLFVVLSTFTLFSYRNALSLLTAERQEEAARLARTVADRLSVPGGPTPGAMRDLVPGAAGVALVGEGELPAGHPRLARPFGIGPDEALPDTVAGFAPLGGPGERRYIRVELPAGALAAQRRAIFQL